ncbi:hypothetical protein D3C86_1569860 [compost metagenome]
MEAHLDAEPINLGNADIRIKEHLDRADDLASGANIPRQADIYGMASKVLGTCWTRRYPHKLKIRIHEPSPSPPGKPPWKLPEKRLHSIRLQIILTLVHKQRVRAIRQRIRDYRNSVSHHTASQGSRERLSGRHYRRCSTCSFFRARAKSNQLSLAGSSPT